MDWVVVCDAWWWCLNPLLVVVVVLLKPFTGVGAVDVLEHAGPVGVLLLLESRCAFGWLGCERCLGRFSGAVFVECEEPPWWCAVGGCDCWAATSGAGRHLGRGHPCRRRAGVVRGHIGTRAGGRLRGLDLARPSSSECGLKFGLPARCTRACAMRRRRPAGEATDDRSRAAVASRLCRVRRVTRRSATTGTTRRHVVPTPALSQKC